MILELKTRVMMIRGSVWMTDCPCQQAQQRRIDVVNGRNGNSETTLDDDHTTIRDVETTMNNGHATISDVETTFNNGYATTKDLETTLNKGH